ncbi:hypothetical protein BV210_17260 [Halorientalis sp. IM1011]|uniref:branched-chain amino acid ABC transporter permease n=1 Tax=Halorientalis sp. IM1011 TaxID=1932360 RepID=UPI00097CCCAB|nr:branched-chain amino acid ABC transporter permease [Halorientalis sp. IM1011]AQL44359.1 hypothetical protein BV210_17260 [Halorientalis sp. IM1011]
MIDTLLTYTLHGTAYGLTLLLLALGLSLIFGVGNVVNFAHGALYMAGAYVAFSAYNLTGSFVVAFVAAVALIGLLGIAFEIVLLRPLYGDSTDQLLMTFGAIFIIEGLIHNVYGSIPKRASPPAIVDGTVDLAGMSYPTYRIFVMVAAVCLTAAVWILLEHTDYGVRLRASAFSGETVSALGTNTDHLRTATFAFGSILAGIAGALVLPLYSASPDMGGSVIITVFIIVVVGGLGSFRGAVVGSMLIGYVETFGQLVVPGYQLLLSYLALILVLLLAPRGLFGQHIELE